MAEKMKTQLAKETYKLRQQIVEPVLGDMKENKGFRAFLTRRIKAVKAEFNIICTALNVKRIWTSLRGINRERREILYQPA